MFYIVEPGLKALALVLVLETTNMMMNGIQALLSISALLSTSTYCAPCNNKQVCTAGERSGSGEGKCASPKSSSGKGKSKI
mmetsp:Transcript_11241/g.27378  ORF Transcript_11241/g.27378 Transcript_11241/m.27378 type:complete len:81 (+) Transcript_11241:997-1239(+)